MDQQLQQYLYLRMKWQKQHQENQRTWDFDSAQTSHSIIKTLMSRIGKLMVNTGQYLQTISKPLPQTRHAHN